MKKVIRYSFTGMVAALCISANLFAQTVGTLTFSFTPVTHSPCYSGTQHVLAVWIQTTAGGFVKTKLRYCCGGNTLDHLPTWSVNAGGSAGNCSAANKTDATTGATLSTWNAQTIVWDGKNVNGTSNGTTVADGTYQVSIQETWNHGTGYTTTKTYTFTKGPNPDHQTPANNSDFTNVKLDWVPSASAPTVTTNAVGIKCNGSSTGSATATPSGGTSPYTYSWSTSPVQTTQTATGLAAGTYTVTVKDANAASTTATVSVTQPPALLASASSANVSCNGAANGSATVSSSGGTPGYAYSWSNGATTSAINGLAAGNYTATVTDANGCTKTATVSVTEPPALLASANSTSVSCNGGSNGSATANPSGGTPGYSYSWNNGQKAATATGLSAGSYTVTVTDAAGCTKAATVSVAQPPTALTSTATSTNANCNSSNGSASVNAGGGTGAYTYLWSNGKTTASITGLPANIYSVTVTDANGCTSVSTANVLNSGAPTASVTPTNVTGCNGAKNGSATVSASGGTGALTYSWNTTPVQTTATATGLGAGVYTITVTDATGCYAKATATITQPSVVTASAAPANAVGCYGGTNGSATVSPSGGTPAYTYLWSNGQAAQTATGLAAGTYTVTVTDASGCSAQTTVTMTQPAVLTASTTPVNASSCSTSDGSIASNVSGGTPPYTYLWSNNKTTSAISGLAAGTYSLTVTDSKGCTQATSGTINCSASAPDAGVLSITSPGGKICGSSFTPVVKIKNFGAVNLTSCVINYYIDAPPAKTYNWSGTLSPGSSANVTLPAMTAGAGTHTFVSYSSNPNGAADGNTANDQSQILFTISNPSAVIPLTEGFETNASLPAGWSLYNPDGDAAWQISTTVARTGNNCIGFDNCDGNGAGVDMTGTKDRFITAAYDFSNATNSASLSFDVAYAVVSYKGQTYTDSLAVYYSLNCDTTNWTRIYLKGGASLATAPALNGAQSSCWAPGAAWDWRTELIPLGSLAGQSSVRFAFENRSDWGEWIYLDNINVNALTAISPVNSPAPFSIYPNPASTSFMIEGTSQTGKIQYAVYNVIGSELKSGEIATGGHTFSGKVQVSDLPRGMYFIRISDGTQAWTQKLEVE